jgi:hypothetical protein
MAAMTESIRGRSIVALFAAYVIALQALFLPLSVAAGPAAAGSSLCLSAASGGGGPPAHDQSGCPCAAGCGVQCCAQAAFFAAPFGVARSSGEPFQLRQTHFETPLFSSFDFVAHPPRGPPEV